MEGRREGGGGLMSLTVPENFSSQALWRGLAGNRACGGKAGHEVKSITVVEVSEVRVNLFCTVFQSMLIYSYVESFVRVSFFSDQQKKTSVITNKSLSPPTCCAENGVVYVFGGCFLLRLSFRAIAPVILVE